MRTDNVPASLLDEAVREQLYGRHKPYAMPVIGYADDIKKLGVNELTAFYRRLYAPNNAILIVAGDTTPEAVRKLAERYYGPIAEPQDRGRVAGPSQGGTDLPQQVSPRRCAGRRAALVARLWLAPSYRVGETKYAYALQVLARLFGGSRDQPPVARSLVEERKIAPLGLGRRYSASSLGLTSFDIGVHPAQVAQHGRGRGGGDRRDEEAARRRRHRRGSRARAEPAAGRRDLCPGFAGQRPAHLRRGAEHRRHHGRYRCLARSASPPSRRPRCVAAARLVWRDDGRGHLAADARREGSR